MPAFIFFFPHIRFQHMLTIQRLEKVPFKLYYRGDIVYFLTFEHGFDGLRWKQYSEVSWKENLVREESFEQKYTTQQQGDLELVTGPL